MQQSRTRAIQSLKGGRNFSASASRPAVSPFKRPAQAAAAKVVKEDVRRPQSTAAAAATQAQSRARPAPAFNREDYNVQPLKPYRTTEMDHSFVGMTGGEIFHEMMLRQGVKHICTTCFLPLLFFGVGGDVVKCRNFDVSARD
jgi:acetolactate synthase-1/2/3 large subunit